MARADQLVALSNAVGKVLGYVHHKKSCKANGIPASNFQKLLCTCGKDAAVQALHDARKDLT